MIFLELGFSKWDIPVYIFIVTEKFAAPSIGTPIIPNLYLNETIKSVAIHNAENSAPKVELSTLFWLLEYHMINAELQYQRIPVWDLTSCSISCMVRINKTIGLNWFSSWLRGIWWNLISGIIIQILHRLNFNLNIFITCDTLITFIKG